MGPSPSLGGGGPAGWSIFCRRRISLISFVANNQLGSGRQAYPDHLGADFGYGLILRQGNVGQQWGVADNVGECVAVDVGLELPARRVGMPGADVFGLEALEFLLRAEFVGLCVQSVHAPGPNNGGRVPY